MNNRRVGRWIILPVMLAAMIVMLLTSGCFTGVMGITSEDLAINDPGTAPENFNADEQAAADALETYFVAFAAKDAQAMADSMCSECLLDYVNAQSGATEQSFVDLMQGNLDATAADLGEGYVMHYDAESFRVKDAQDYAASLNAEFGAGVDGKPGIDMAKIVSADVWMTNSDGVDLKKENGSMLVYRYDGQWYIYTYAG